MAELQLKSNRFRIEREADWRRLETLLAKVEAGSPRKLTTRELLEVPVLYRSALASLSTARSISLDQSLVDYLEALCARAYFLVYGARASLSERVGRFFAHDWPAAVRALWRETLAAAALGALGAVLAYLAVRADPDWFYAFMSAQQAEGRDPAATAEALRKTLYASGDWLSVLAAYLFTHNAQIALLAFALGFAVCIPTAALLVSNGVALGAFLAVFAAKGLTFQAVGWLMIHGVTELFAITLAGAAGFSIGLAVAFPGARTRMEAAAHAGRRAGTAMAGVVIMLFVAGLLEGLGRQLIQADLLRYGVAATSAVAWGLYFYAPRRAL